MAKVALIGVKYCITVHIGPGQIFSRFGAVPQDALNLKFVA